MRAPGRPNKRPPITAPPAIMPPLPPLAGFEAVATCGAPVGLAVPPITPPGTTVGRGLIEIGSEPSGGRLTVGVALTGVAAVARAVAQDCKAWRVLASKVPSGVSSSPKVLLSQTWKLWSIRVSRGP